MARMIVARDRRRKAHVAKAHVEECTMAKSKKINARTEIDPASKTVKRFYDVQEKVAGGSDREKAEAFLKKAAVKLQINPDLSQLKFEQVKDTILGKHVLYQQYVDGKPITGAWARVDIGKDGQVYNVQVESRCYAVFICAAYLLPALSVAGASLASP
jgi:Zn-dependent metalloprotease